MRNWIVNMRLKNQKQNKALLVKASCFYAKAGLLPCMALGLMLISSGCVAKRGVDFGHWARTAERVELVKVFVDSEHTNLKGNEIVLLLPPFGSILEKHRKDLQNNLFQEMRNYFPARVIMLEKNSSFSEYLDGDNMLYSGNVVNPQEAGKIGQLAGATHVVCVVVNELRPYQPQNLSLTIHVIDSKLCKSIGEMNANLDCAEQQVVMAMSDYLQGREARKHDIQSLDILLSSPTHFSAFASAKCSKVLAENLWKGKELKQLVVIADK